MRYTEQVEFVPASVGKQHIRLQLKPSWVAIPFKHNPIWKRIHETFNEEHFLYSCPPVDLSEIVLAPDKTKIRIARCPVKVPDTNELIIPTELKNFMPLIRYATETELSINPDFNKFHAHITVENTVVSTKKTQRVAGWHVDGFQGVRAERHQIEHSYIWIDTVPTEFSLQPFFLQHLDPSRHNIFHEISRQASETNTYKGLENHLYLIDPYVVHRSPVVSTKTQRRFFRMTFTATELEDPVNTVNLSLPQKSYEDRIDVRDRLFSYKGEHPHHFYGVGKS